MASSEREMNVIAQKMEDGENAALTTPLTLTGTAEELDRDLPVTVVNFVSAHLELRNTLDPAKAEMDVAAKTAQADVRSKSETAATKPAHKPEAKIAEAAKLIPQTSSQPARAASLFDAPTPASVPMPDTDEEEQNLSEDCNETQASDADELES
jgi:PRTRC genetic system protein E